MTKLINLVLSLGPEFKAHYYDSQEFCQNGNSLRHIYTFHELMTFQCYTVTIQSHRAVFFLTYSKHNPHKIVINRAFFLTLTHNVYLIALHLNIIKKLL